jgi:hypothetical protein
VTSTAALSPAVDPGQFASTVLGVELFDHQLAFARSSARYRVMCAGRQVGKSTVLAVVALHEASTRRNISVLLVSSGEDSSKELLATCAAFASASPALSGSVLDETKSELVLSNGSTITSVPASTKRIRGRSIDLLVLDEAGWISDELWQAAEPSIVARPGSRVILSSTPWGSVEHFFRVNWRRGMDSPGLTHESFHWPSTESPLADQGLIELWRETWPAYKFETEVLAQWTDDSGAYFGEAELEGAVADYELVSPEAALRESVHEVAGERFPVAGGIDWGQVRDQNVVVLVGALDDEGLNGDEVPRFFVPWLEGRHRWGFEDFISTLVAIPAGGYDVKVYASETNGIGAWPTDDLRARMLKAGRAGTPVRGVWTDNRRKQSGFGMVKSLLQSGRLVLPRHPGLLSELRALEFEQLPGGSVRIAVPDRSGHDDLAMGLMQAVSCIHPQALSQRQWEPGRRRSEETLTTKAGVLLPARPLPAARVGWTFVSPKGAEGSSPW